MDTPILRLKAGKEANAAFRHPWIFSGALAAPPKEDLHGRVVRVEDKTGKILGTGTASSRGSIAVRLFAFREETLDAAWFARRLREADARRLALGYGPGTDTDGYRIVFGEADGLPGIVLDRFGSILVLQISTAGAETLKPLFLEAIREVFAPAAIVERSDMTVRRDEGLKETAGVLEGEPPERIEFKENGLRFLADVVGGQKTGFFLDQKDLRARIRGLAAGRSVLNLFSYSGAAGIAAMKGGAASVLNVDASPEALALCAEHARMNGVDAAFFRTQEADVFQFLGGESEETYGMVLLDPPALIKTRGDLEAGAKAYHFLNRAAMRRVEDGGILVTSSCSHFLTEEDLAFILRRASVQAGVHLSLLGVVRQSPDHPESVYFPESRYLSSFICEVRKA